MSLWPWSRGEKRDGPTSGLATPSGWMLDAFTTGPTASGKRVTVDTALGLSPVWSAVSLISEQVGTLPLKVYRQLDGHWTEAMEHRAWRMLHDKPNEYTPASRFWATATLQLLLWGNVFIEKRRTNGVTVDELWLIDPATMLVKWDAATRTKTFRHIPADGGEPRDLTTDQVLHVYGASRDGVIGMSVIQQCRNGFGAALAREEFEGGFYRRGATLSGIIEHPGQLSAPAVENLKRSFASAYQGSGQAHGVPVLEENATFRAISSPLRDLEFVASQQLTRTDIAVMFKLPPHFLGGTTGDSLTYNTVEQSQIQLAVHAITPPAATIAAFVSTDPAILPQNVFRAEFVLEGLMRADSAGRAAFYEKMVAMKAMTVNEVRARENLPPVDGGDEISEPQPVVQVPPDGGGMMPTGAGMNGNGASPDEVQA